MKKVFLLLASAFMGVAAFAGNEWSLEDGTITVKYNSFGKADESGTSIQWQAGNAAAFPDAVEEASGNTLWTPALGEKFMVTLKGTANMTGKMQMFMADEREEVSYWTPLCATYGEVEVVAGEAFTLETVFTVDKVAFDEETPLTLPGLILAYEYPGTSEDEGFDATEDFVIEGASLEILYAEAANIVDPITLSYSKQDGDAFQFQGILNSKVTAAKAGQFANVKFEGVAQNDITTLMYALVDNSEQAGWWKQMTDEMVSFKANIKKGDKVSVQFSFEITGETPSSSPVFKDVLLANAESKGMSVDFSNASIEVSVTDAALYGGPVLDAVEEVSNVAIENGVVYSAGEIVVYNVAGQVVATASQEFSINSLNAGVYFVATAEGTAKIVK
ncbi:MAG: T9SS type A sorting domain-containing protein [Bacteroidales bacterium]|nr:T9SS type A sorting domain-containing protein [Bacteroidales bacterium]